MNIDKASNQRGIENSLRQRRKTQSLRREKVKRLWGEGNSIAAIARHLNVSRRTIEKDIKSLEEHNV